jgi:ABC-type multidrug transport system ATPase subunit/ABC-type multidrug transport system permease subunit
MVPLLICHSSICQRLSTSTSKRTTMADSSSMDHYGEAPAIEYSYTDAKALMQHGPEALHAHVSSRIEAAMGKALPQMEVRFKNLSISADIMVSSDKDSQHELPTIANELKKSLSKFSAKKNRVTKHILKNVNGVFKPGTITLVLGQPGSGKSSLMKILSGRFPMTKNVTLEGDVTYNGASREELLKRMPQYVSYVTQRDHHFPTLTVKETLEFAHECCGGELSERAISHFNKGTDAENKQALEAATALYQFLPEVIIQQLGLENCQDTIVGNAMLRGVSGGERKRVTTGEMQFGNKYVTLMDEISTGLDSAATFDIIKTQRSIAKTLRKTVVIALLQPSPEVFALFDDVLILNKGRVMYHGPRDQALGYFQDMGFHCPPRRDVADYLLDLGTPQQHQYEVARKDGSKHPRKAREFAELFEKSAIHDAMLSELHGPHDPALLRDKEQHFDAIPEFHQSFLESTATLMARQTKVTLRNTAFIKGRGLMVIVMGLLYATTFWQFDVTNVQVVMGIMFAAVLFLALGQASQIPTFLAAREIFYKQRGANFYRTSSYVLACSVAQLPLALLESIVFGTMIYWMCGFVSTVGAYLVFLALLFLTNLAFAAWFFFLAAISPDLHVAKPVSMISVMFYILFAGFVISRNQIPDYFIWAYWLNPIAWCLRSLGINQYRNAQFNVNEYHGIDYFGRFHKQMGEYSLGLFDVQSDKAWLAYGFIFLLASYVVFMWLSYVALEFKRYESPEHVALGGDEDDAHVQIESSTSDSYGLVETPRVDATGELTLEVTRLEHERHFVPVTLAFQDLWYSVPNPTNPKEDLDLLKGISGYAKPGTMTALMGSSGAGKTTLMDVIAGRKTGGKIQGKILLNGYEATDLAIRRSTGYCEQMDIHSEAATIREALVFSAFLRQDAGVPDAQKFDSVEECLDLLDLRPIADQIIRGSSVEQMKRLTIGVELAAQPSVLFLDEPTSGLDARSAKVIMDGVRKVADTGRTIVCTIHQPSSEVFQVFDSLLLLKRGGETVYFGELGENASQLIQYFEGIDGTPRLEDGYNPATWMLEVIGAGVGNAASQDFVRVFNESDKKFSLETNLNQDGVARPASGQSALEFTSKRAALESVQAKFLIQRFFAMYWRTPSYNLTRFTVCTMLALIFGLSYLDADYDSFQGINAGEGMVFMTTVFIGVISFNSVLPIASEERASFYRERAAQTYNALWYFVGSTLAEIPYVFASSFVYTAIFFPMVGFTGVGAFFFYWLNTALHMLLQAYVGQFLAYALPSVEVAAIIGVLVNSIFFLFMGFNPPADAIPSGYKWLYHITPQRYTLAILSSIVFGDCDGSDLTKLGCQPVRNLPITSPQGLTVKQYVEKVFLMKRSDMWMDFGVLLAFIVFFRVLALLSLRYINHQKR